jgi:ADP-heptose:LPS heptosyltransferase
MVFWPVLLFIDVLGYLLFFWKRFARMPEPKRILLIRLEQVGDVLMTTPALRALRKQYPKAQIDILVRDFTAPVLAGNKNISTVLVCNAPWMVRFGKSQGWKAAAAMLRRLKARKYDIAVDMHGDPRNILLANKVARYVVGFGTRGCGFMVNRRVRYKGHTIDRNLALVRAIGAVSAGREMEMPASSAAKLLPAGRWVCIAPGSSRKEKNWLNHRWAAVADRLIERHGVKIVFTGSAKESALAQDIVSRMRHADQTLNLCGKTSLSRLAGVVQRCLLTLCPDAGTMHVSRAVGTPLVGLFTFEDAKEWGYHERKFRSISGKGAEAITVEQVLEKATAILAKD